MTRLSRVLLAAVLGGVLNVVVVLSLYARGSYPALESTAGSAFLVTTGFTLGFALVFVTVYTQLLSPVLGFLSVLTATTYLEWTTPQPEWGELNGHVVVDGPTHVSSYANTWSVWLSLFLFVGVVEFAIRRGYGLGDIRLRNLPPLPLSRSVLAGVVTVCSGFLGIATMLLVVRSGVPSFFAALTLFAVVTVVAAVPLVALLARGLLVPAVLFVLLVPYLLSVEVFLTTDSPVHILLLGPYAVVLAVVALLESVVRSRLQGWDGGRFATQRAR